MLVIIYTLAILLRAIQRHGKTTCWRLFGCLATGGTVHMAACTENYTFHLKQQKLHFVSKELDKLALAVSCHKKLPVRVCASCFCHTFASLDLEKVTCISTQVPRVQVNSHRNTHVNLGHSGLQKDWAPFKYTPATKGSVWHWHILSGLRSRWTMSLSAQETNEAQLLCQLLATWALSGTQRKERARVNVFLFIPVASTTHLEPTKMCPSWMCNVTDL